MSLPANTAAFLRVLGIDPEAPAELTPEDLRAAPKSQWLQGAEVELTSAIRRYLDSGDHLTHHTLDMVELALETHYGAPPEWYVTSSRQGNEEDGNLRATSFFIMPDPDFQKP